MLRSHHRRPSADSMIKRHSKLELTQNRLPQNRAYVVQFSAHTDFASNRVQGRVEHIASGTVLHFKSREELLEFTATMLPT